MPKFRTLANRTVDFLQNQIWRYDKDKLPRPVALLLRSLQIFVTAVRGYIKDNCALYASALTFYSLLSVVPVAAMAFGIAKGFGLEQRLEKLLYLRFAGQEEVLSRIIDFARSLLENTKGGLIVGIGVAVLFWSGIKVMSHIESTLNTIWRVSGRSFIRKFTDYLAILIISPLLVIVSGSVNVFIKTQILAATEKWAVLEAAGPLILTSLKLLPFGLIWLLFIMIYMVMPNTLVRFRSALIAGIIAGSLYQLIQGIYISAQVVVSSYNAIYGSFAALPLFLIWMQISWMVVLFGAQIAHAHQYIGRFSMGYDFQSSRPEFRKRCALHILHWIIRQFSDGAAPPTGKQISQHLVLPDAMVEKLLGHLHQCGLISIVVTDRADGAAYQPARDIHTITIASVLDALDRLGQPAISANQLPEFDAITQAVDAIRDEIDRSPANILVKDI
jgi:membrane protein